LHHNNAPPRNVPPPRRLPPSATTVTLKQLAPELAETNELTKKQTEAVLNTLVEMVTARLKAGDKVRLTGLGILQVRARPARTGRNPATGQPIAIGASKKRSPSVPPRNSRQPSDRF
jgi:DNA-binding protein HU-beta